MNIIAPTSPAQQAQALDTVAHWFKHNSRRKKVFRLFNSEVLRQARNTSAATARQCEII